MIGEYNPGALVPYLADQVTHLDIGWPLGAGQVDAQPYVVMPDGTRRPYGAVEPDAADVSATVPAVQTDNDLGQAWAAGSEMGRRYAGDPWRAARDEDLETILVSRQEMARLGTKSADDGHRMIGRLITNSESARIYVLATLSPTEQNITVAHEVAHWLHFGASETFCDHWARAFCSQAGRR